MLINKKAQIGETITWIIATIIIIGILTISVFISSALGEGKSEIRVDGKEKDLLISKSITAYLLTKTEKGKTVYEELRDEEIVDQNIKKLTENIFWDMNKGKYGVHTYLEDKINSQYLFTEKKKFQAENYGDPMVYKIKIGKDKTLMVSIWELKK